VINKNTKTALYRHFDTDDNLLYVGVSLSSVNRLSQHKSNSHWFYSIARQEIEYFDSREEALKAEAEAIRNENPNNNIMGSGITFKRKDSKQKRYNINPLIDIKVKDIELTKTGLNTAKFIKWAIKNNHTYGDTVLIDKITLNDFLKCKKNDAKGNSLQSLRRGLVELEKENIVAKSRRQGSYFINPNFVFKGDRIAFATVLEKDSKM
jgi:predicted GIY-YIG superfamily endonuclease